MSLQTRHYTDRLLVERAPAAAGGAWVPVASLWSTPREPVPGPDPLTGSIAGTATYRLRTRYQSLIRAGMRGYCGAPTRILHFADVMDPDGRKRDMEIIAVELTALTTLTISRQVPGTYDPAIDTRPPGSTSTVTVAAFAVTPDGGELRRYQENGWNLQRTVSLIVAAGSLGAHVPAPDDKVNWGGQIFALREIAFIGPSATPLFYRFVVSR